MKFHFDNQTVKLIKEIQSFVKQNKSYKSLINFFPIPVFYKDEDGMYLDCNIAFAFCVKLPKEKILGKKAKDLASETVIKAILQSDDELKDGGSPTIISEMECGEDGQRKLIVIKESYHDEETNAKRIVGFCLDKVIFYGQMSDLTLAKKVEEYNKVLINYALKLESSTNFLNQLKHNIQSSARKDIIGKEALYKAEQSIDHFLKNEFWISPLTHQLKSTQPDFYIKLKEKYPKLSSLDMKICALVKMQISSKEIADILCVNTSSTEQSLYRIRQKMGIKGKGSLQKTLLEF